MKSCVIFGGAGYIGTNLAKHFLKTGRFDHVHIADINKSSLEGHKGITTSITDVRAPIDRKLITTSPDWIFNLAAIHREPGHIREEYYDTNLTGADNVCDYADKVKCENIYFTSSISVYGPTVGPTDESNPIQPSTPYGGSKYSAELIHKMWMRTKAGRRLLIARPGVIYGPGDPGNIMRMINAIRKGYFAFPGSTGIYKSYGYIFGFLNSVDFVMDSSLEYCCYNYAETPTQPLGELVNEIKKLLKKKAVVIPIPISILMPISKIVQAIFGFKNPVHPVRIKKAATSTHIIPQTLLDMNFEFKYTFLNSLEHWKRSSPEDFGMETKPAKSQSRAKLRLERGSENIDDHMNTIKHAETSAPKKEETVA